MGDLQGRIKKVMATKDFAESSDSTKTASDGKADVKQAFFGGWVRVLLHIYSSDSSFLVFKPFL